MAKKKEQEEKKSPGDNRDEQLALLFKQAEKNYGQGTIGFAAHNRHGDYGRITSGVLGLDISLGGGFPVGRLSCAYGPKSSSKTTSFLRAGGRAQRMCSSCWTPAFDIWDVSAYGKGKPRCACKSYRKTNIAWIDAEGAWDDSWASRFLSIDDVVLSQPETGEQAADLIDGMLRSGAVDIIVIDSIAMMVPTEEIDKSASDMQVGAQARLLGKSFRKIISGLNAVASREGRRPTVWYTNQVRQKVGVMFGNPEVQPGGLSGGFNASTETRMSPGATDKDTGTGFSESVELKYRNEKNKCGRPKMGGEYKVCMMNVGARKMGDVMDETFALKIGKLIGLIQAGSGARPTVCEGVEYRTQSLLVKYWVENAAAYESFKNKIIERACSDAPLLDHVINEERDAAAAPEAGI